MYQINQESKSQLHNVLANLITMTAKIKSDGRIDSYAYKVGVLKLLNDPIRSDYYGKTIDEIIMDMSIMSDDLMYEMSHHEPVNVFIWIV